MNRQRTYNTDSETFYVDAAGTIHVLESPDAGVGTISELPDDARETDAEGYELPDDAITADAEADGWRQTHEIVFTTPIGRREVWHVGLTDEGAAHTAREWVGDDGAAWGVVDGEWLCEGQTTTGGANGEVYVRKFPPQKSGGIDSAKP